ncbi:ribosome maturation factor RimM [Pantoea sp. Mhis]|uniref:ribosome maturation factor RimM n=1 Tax=Pantoea sp. Mhis TaxID=2576759 RepID=UPI00135ADDA0|nr:ribosome maturation factor RimM [Pantoea sp. Mhis]MXP56628.1 ribosome maturation factor RimM [Pantoea sp. Mhis]
MYSPIHPLVVGKIGIAYGVRGWLKLFSSTDNIESIFYYQPWFIYRHSKWQYINVENWKHHNQGLIIKLKDINDRNTALQLTNAEIIIEKTRLVALEDNEYYWSDLIDCNVITLSGYDMGRVINFIQTGSNDVLVVKANLNDCFNIKQRLIPFIDKQVIKKINLFKKKIQVDWDPGF